MQNRAPSGRLIACDASLGGASLRADKLAWPLGVVVSSDGNEVWVAESWAHRLTAFPRTGGDRRQPRFRPALWVELYQRTRRIDFH
ncbi:hypothetical protein [Bradyrhizobium sp. USDA 3240]